MEEFDRTLGIVGDKSKYTGSMQREFDEVSKTTTNAMQLMENAFDNVAKVVGDIFLAPLMSVAKFVANLTDTLVDYLETMPILSKAICYGGAALLGFKVAIIGQIASAL